MVITEQHADRDLWNLETVRDWLHRCLDVQPEICRIAESFGWKMNPAYYYLRMRHNFAFKAIGFNQYRLVDVHGFANSTERLEPDALRRKLVEARPATKLRIILEQVFAAKDLTAFEPWGDLDFYLERPISLVQMTVERVIRSPQDTAAMQCKIMPGDYGIAALGDKGCHNWILMTCGAETPFSGTQSTEYQIAGAKIQLSETETKALYLGFA